MSHLISGQDPAFCDLLSNQSDLLWSTCKHLDIDTVPFCYQYYPSAIHVYLHQPYHGIASQLKLDLSNPHDDMLCTTTVLQHIQSISYSIDELTSFVYQNIPLPSCKLVTENGIPSLYSAFTLLIVNGYPFTVFQYLFSQIPANEVKNVFTFHLIDIALLSQRSLRFIQQLTDLILDYFPSSILSVPHLDQNAGFPSDYFDIPKFYAHAHNPALPILDDLHPHIPPNASTECIQGPSTTSVQPAGVNGIAPSTHASVSPSPGAKTIPTTPYSYPAVHIPPTLKSCLGQSPLVGRDAFRQIFQYNINYGDTPGLASFSFYHKTRYHASRPQRPSHYKLTSPHSHMAFHMLTYQYQSYLPSDLYIPHSVSLLSSMGLPQMDRTSFPNILTPISGCLGAPWNSSNNSLNLFPSQHYIEPTQPTSLTKDSYATPMSLAQRPSCAITTAPGPCFSIPPQPDALDAIVQVYDVTNIPTPLLLRPDAGTRYSPNPHTASAPPKYHLVNYLNYMSRTWSSTAKYRRGKMNSPYYHHPKADSEPYHLFLHFNPLACSISNADIANPATRFMLFKTPSYLVYHQLTQLVDDTVVSVLENASLARARITERRSYYTTTYQQATRKRMEDIRKRIIDLALLLLSVHPSGEGVESDVHQQIPAVKDDSSAGCSLDSQGTQLIGVIIRELGDPTMTSHSFINAILTLHHPMLQIDQYRHGLEIYLRNLSQKYLKLQQRVSPSHIQALINQTGISLKQIDSQINTITIAGDRYRFHPRTPTYDKQPSLKTNPFHFIAKLLLKAMISRLTMLKLHPVFVQRAELDLNHLLDYMIMLDLLPKTSQEISLAADDLASTASSGPTTPHGFGMHNSYGNGPTISLGGTHSDINSLQLTPQESIKAYHRDSPSVSMFPHIRQYVTNSLRIYHCGTQAPSTSSPPPLPSLSKLDAHNVLHACELRIYGGFSSLTSVFRIFQDIILYHFPPFLSSLLLFSCDAQDFTSFFDTEDESDVMNAMARLLARGNDTASPPRRGGNGDDNDDDDDNDGLSDDDDDDAEDTDDDSLSDGDGDGDGDSDSGEDDNSTSNSGSDNKSEETNDREDTQATEERGSSPFESDALEHIARLRRNHIIQSYILHFNVYIDYFLLHWSYTTPTNPFTNPDHASGNLNPFFEGMYEAALSTRPYITCFELFHIQPMSHVLPTVPNHSHNDQETGGADKDTAIDQADTGQGFNSHTAATPAQTNQTMFPLAYLKIYFNTLQAVCTKYSLFDVDYSFSLSYRDGSTSITPPGQVCGGEDALPIFHDFSFLQSGYPHPPLPLDFPRKTTAWISLAKAPQHGYRTHLNILSPSLGVNIIEAHLPSGLLPELIKEPSLSVDLCYELVYLGNAKRLTAYTHPITRQSLAMTAVVRQWSPNHIFLMLGLVQDYEYQDALGATLLVYMLIFATYLTSAEIVISTITNSDCGRVYDMTRLIPTFTLSPDEDGNVTFTDRLSYCPPNTHCMSILDVFLYYSPRGIPPNPYVYATLIYKMHVDGFVRRNPHYYLVEDINHADTYDTLLEPRLSKVYNRIIDAHHASGLHPLAFSDGVNTTSPGNTGSSSSSSSKSPSSSKSSSKSKSKRSGKSSSSSLKSPSAEKASSSKDKIHAPSPMSLLATPSSKAILSLDDTLGLECSFDAFLSSVDEGAGDQRPSSNANSSDTTAIVDTTHLDSNTSDPTTDTALHHTDHSSSPKKITTVTTALAMKEGDNTIHTTHVQPCQLHDPTSSLPTPTSTTNTSHVPDIGESTDSPAAPPHDLSSSYRLFVDHILHLLSQRDGQTDSNTSNDNNPYNASPSPTDIIDTLFSILTPSTHASSYGTNPTAKDYSLISQVFSFHTIKYAMMANLSPSLLLPVLQQRVKHMTSFATNSDHLLRSLHLTPTRQSDNRDKNKRNLSDTRNKRGKQDDTDCDATSTPADSIIFYFDWFLPLTHPRRAKAQNKKQHQLDTLKRLFRERVSHERMRLEKEANSFLARPYSPTHQSGHEASPSNAFPKSLLKACDPQYRQYIRTQKTFKRYIRELPLHKQWLPPDNHVKRLNRYEKDNIRACLVDDKNNQFISSQFTQWEQQQISVAGMIYPMVVAQYYHEQPKMCLIYLQLFDLIFFALSCNYTGTTLETASLRPMSPSFDNTISLIDYMLSQIPLLLLSPLYRLIINVIMKNDRYIEIIHLLATKYSFFSNDFWFYLSPQDKKDKPTPRPDLKRLNTPFREDMVKYNFHEAFLHGASTPFHFLQRLPKELSSGSYEAATDAVRRTCQTQILWERPLFIIHPQPLFAVIPSDDTYRQRCESGKDDGIGSLLHTVMTTTIPIDATPPEEPEDAKKKKKKASKASPESIIISNMSAQHLHIAQQRYCIAHVNISLFCMFYLTWIRLQMDYHYYPPFIASIRSITKHGTDKPCNTPHHYNHKDNGPDQPTSPTPLSYPPYHPLYFYQHSFHIQHTLVSINASLSRLTAMHKDYDYIRLGFLQNVLFTLPKYQFDIVGANTHPFLSHKELYIPQSLPNSGDAIHIHSTFFYLTKYTLDTINTGHVAVLESLSPQDKLAAASPYSRNATWLRYSLIEPSLVRDQAKCSLSTKYISLSAAETTKCRPHHHTILSTLLSLFFSHHMLFDEQFICDYVSERLVHVGDGGSGMDQLSNKSEATPYPLKSATLGPSQNHVGVDSPSLFRNTQQLSSDQGKLVSIANIFHRVDDGAPTSHTGSGVIRKIYTSPRVLRIQKSLCSLCPRRQYNPFGYHAIPTRADHLNLLPHQSQVTPKYSQFHSLLYDVFYQAAQPLIRDAIAKSISRELSKKYCPKTPTDTPDLEYAPNTPFTAYDLQPDLTPPPLAKYLDIPSSILLPLFTDVLTSQQEMLEFYITLFYTISMMSGPNPSFNQNPNVRTMVKPSGLNPTEKTYNVTIRSSFYSYSVFLLNLIDSYISRLDTTMNYMKHLVEEIATKDYTVDIMTRKITCATTQLSTLRSDAIHHVLMYYASLKPS